MVKDATTEAGGIAHELGHHLQKTWVAPVLYGTPVVYCTWGQDNECVRHEIAGRVEEMLLGDVYSGAS